MEKKSNARTHEKKTCLDAKRSSDRTVSVSPQTQHFPNTRRLCWPIRYLAGLCRKNEEDTSFDLSGTVCADFSTEMECFQRSGCAFVDGYCEAEGATKGAVPETQPETQPATLEPTSAVRAGKKCGMLGTGGDLCR